MQRFGLALIVLVGMSFAAAAEDEQGFVRLVPDELEWVASDTPGLDFAYIVGNPNEDGFYIVRARFSPGVTSSPHYHATDRHVTVISGVWHTGTDTSYDLERTVPLGPGSYMLHPAGAVHYDGAIHETAIVEIKGIGPAPTIRVDIEE